MITLGGVTELMEIGDGNKELANGIIGWPAAVRKVRRSASSEGFGI